MVQLEHVSLNAH